MRHNKKRNTGLLYEFLIRHVSKCLIENKTAEAKKAVGLLKKYYQSGLLREELELFKTTLGSRVMTTDYASRLIAESVKQSARFSHKKSDGLKTKLIKDINESFDAADFYSHKIPHYVMYASLQTLMNHGNGGKKLHESMDRIRVEERLAKFLTSEKDATQNMREALKLDPSYNSAVYRIVVNKFDKKYAGVLSESQKRLLTKYAIAVISESTEVLERAVIKEIDGLKERLSIITDGEVLRDKDLMTKISECRVQLNALDTKNISDQNLTTILRFMSLADEVAS